MLANLKIIMFLNYYLYLLPTRGEFQLLICKYLTFLIDVLKRGNKMRLAVQYENTL